MFSRLAATFLTLLACTAVANAALNFGGAKWVWTSDAAAGTLKALPVESVAFRKDITTGFKIPTTVEVIMIGDDAFTLFVNGAQVGTGQWSTPQYFCVPVNNSGSDSCYGYNKIVLAVSAANTIASTPSGLLAVVKVNYADGSSDRFVTDKSWLSSLTVPSGFQAVNFNDQSWTPAVEQVAYEDGYATFIPLPPASQVCQ